MPEQAPKHNPALHAEWFMHFRKRIITVSGFRTFLHHTHAGRDVNMDWYLWAISSEEEVICFDVVTWQQLQQRWPEQDFSVHVYLLSRRIRELVERMAAVAATGRMPREEGRVRGDVPDARGTWVGNEGCLEVPPEEDVRG